MNEWTLDDELEFWSWADRIGVCPAQEPEQEPTEDPDADGP